LSVHIEARPGEIAPSVLLPGDPLRAKAIAEAFLEDPVCFNRVRGMLGYTGMHSDRRVSVMGTGMGVPSLSIYVHELATDYAAETLIRVGTCGALQPHLEIGDVVLAMTASTDSHVNRLRFGGMDYAPAADFALLRAAHDAAMDLGARVHVGGVFTSDRFYDEDPDAWRLWARYGALAAEMETSALYTLAATHGFDALSILTVSDSLVTGKRATAEQRETGFPKMTEIALAIAP